MQIRLRFSGLPLHKAVRHVIAGRVMLRMCMPVDRGWHKRLLGWPGQWRSDHGVPGYAQHRLYYVSPLSLSYHLGLLCNHVHAICLIFVT